MFPLAAQMLTPQMFYGPLGTDKTLSTECAPQHNSLVNMMTLACFFSLAVQLTTPTSPPSAYFLPISRRVCNLPLKGLKSREPPYKLMRAQRSHWLVRSHRCLTLHVFDCYQFTSTQITLKYSFQVNVTVTPFTSIGGPPEIF